MPLPIRACFVLSVCLLTASAHAARSRRAAPPAQDPAAVSPEPAPAAPTSAPASAEPTTKPIIDTQAVCRFAADAAKRLVAWNAPGAEGYRDFINHQKPTGTDPESLPSAFGYLTASAQVLSKNADVEHRQKFALDLNGTLHLLRDVPVTPGTPRGQESQAALLLKLQQLREEYRKLVPDNANANANANSAAAPSPAAVKAANTFYDRVAALVRARRAAHPDASSSAARLALEGRPVLDDTGRPSLDAKGTPVTTGGVLGIASSFKQSPDAAHAAALRRAVAHFGRRDAPEDAQLLRQLDTLVKALDNIDGLDPASAPSGGPLRSPTTQRGAVAGNRKLIPAPDNTVIRGQRIYAEDADGKLIPLPDGDYLYHNVPLIVRGGMKVNISN